MKSWSKDWGPLSYSHRNNLNNYNLRKRSASPFQQQLFPPSFGLVPRRLASGPSFRVDPSQFASRTPLRDESRHFTDRSPPLLGPRYRGKPFYSNKHADWSVPHPPPRFRGPYGGGGLLTTMAKKPKGRTPPCHTWCFFFSAHNYAPARLGV